MKTKTKRWITVAVVTVAAGFVGLNVLAYNHAWAMMHFTTDGDPTNKPEALGFLRKVKVLLVGVNIPRPPGNHSPSDLATNGRILRINGPDANGTKIRPVSDASAAIHTRLNVQQPTVPMSSIQVERTQRRSAPKAKRSTWELDIPRWILGVQFPHP